MTKWRREGERRTEGVWQGGKTLGREIQRNGGKGGEFVCQVCMHVHVQELAWAGGK